MKDEEAHKCIQCSNPGGCKYPNAAGGRYSADYFESQKCGNGKEHFSFVFSWVKCQKISYR